MASDLPGELLEEVFLRLDDLTDLARASAACASFRRAVSSGRFLRRLRSLHRPRPVLGLLRDSNYQSETGLFYPAQPPRCSAPAAASFAKAADFTFSSLPGAKRWRVCDVRDGRVLLTRCHLGLYMLEDLVVYDPLHQRHVQIPSIPDDLLLAAEQDGNNEAIMAFDDAFLAAAAAEDERDDDDESSPLRFRVMCTARSKTKVVALVFSSASGQWRCGQPFSIGNSNYVWRLRQYVHGCFCWAHGDEDANVMLVLDTHEMKFSTTDLPHESIRNLMTAVEAGDGRLGLLLLRRDNDGCSTMDLYSKTWQGNGVIQEDEAKWRHDSSIKVPGFKLFLAGTVEGYVLLRGLQDQLRLRDQLRLWCHRKEPEAHYFTLELKTLLVEKLCVLESDSCPNFPYASFPPPFSPPSV